jgi:arylsulfatase A-like enzyme
MSLSRRYFFLGSLALPVFAQKSGNERPNLLLILLDELPAWMLGVYGNKEMRTPNIDRLAETGVRFTRHVVCSPAPGLSRATLLTGRTPMQLGDAENPAAGDAGLDRLLAAAGYGNHVGDTREAVSFLDRQAAGKPFFLTVGYPNLRMPYEGVAQKYRDMYAETRFETLSLQRAAAPNAAAGKEMLADVVGNMRNAAAAITALDDEVAAILSALSRKGLLENTLVVLTASCGALLGRHGIWSAGAGSDPVNMYEEGVVTPMVWSWLGRVPAQAVRPEVVSTYDFVPTICDALDAPPPKGNLCGRSYLLLATGKPLPKREPWRTTVFGHYRNTDMARVERYKLILREGGQGPGELYDLRSDPVEAVNQFANPQFLTVKNSLSKSLAEWKQRYSK